MTIQAVGKFEFHSKLKRTRHFVPPSKSWTLEVEIHAPPAWELLSAVHSVTQTEITRVIEGKPVIIKVLSPGRASGVILE
jgi:hypothetical protein